MKSKLVLFSFLGSSLILLACGLGEKANGDGIREIPDGSIPIAVGIDPAKEGSWAYILETVEGDGDVLVRFGDLKLTRGEVRQGAQEYMEWAPEQPTLEQSTKASLKKLADDLALYSLAIEKGYLVSDSDVQDYIDRFVEGCDGPNGLCHTRFYGITAREYADWKYEAYRRDFSIEGMMDAETDSPDSNLRNLMKRGLVREARRLRDFEWVDQDAQRMYEN